MGLALYGVDIYPVRRYAVANENGEMGVATEGNMFVGGAQGTGHPYPIPYRAITPKAEECTNLLVPVCLSASHIAYGSIRMEPVFMVLGQSAATAAVHAIDERTTVQKIDPKKLEARLLKDGQMLDFVSDPLPPRTGPKHVNPPGIVVDDDAAQLKGFRSSSGANAPFVGHGYLHDANTDKGEQTARFNATLQAGYFILAVRAAGFDFDQFLHRLQHRGLFFFGQCDDGFIGRGKCVAGV